MLFAACVNIFFMLFLITFCLPLLEWMTTQASHMKKKKEKYGVNAICCLIWNMDIVAIRCVLRLFTPLCAIRIVAKTKTKQNRSHLHQSRSEKIDFSKTFGNSFLIYRNFSPFENLQPRNSDISLLISNFTFTAIFNPEAIRFLLLWFCANVASRKFRKIRYWSCV